MLKWQILILNICHFWFHVKSEWQKKICSFHTMPPPYPTVWKSTIKHDQCFYGKINIFSVKSTVLLKKSLTNRFDEIICRWEQICHFSILWTFFCHSDFTWNQGQKKLLQANTECGNFKILLPLRFYVKSILGISKTQKEPFWPI